MLRNNRRILHYDEPEEGTEKPVQLKDEHSMFL